MGVSASIATSMRLSVLLLFTAPVAGSAPAVFSLGNKIPRLVSIHAESTGVTGVFEVRPVLEGSGRDADPCQRQLLGPSVLAKTIALQRTGGGSLHQAHFLLNCFRAVRSICQPDQRLHSISAAVRCWSASDSV